jgi:addiction module RelB/DinJ family antitoxin
MAKSATISMRIDGQLKAEAETIFQQLGMTTTEAIKIFLAAVRNRKGLPFQVQVTSEQSSPLELRSKALDAIVGAYPMISSSADFSLRKQEEIEVEERKFHT